MWWLQHCNTIKRHITYIIIIILHIYYGSYRKTELRRIFRARRGSVTPGGRDEDRLRMKTAAVQWWC